MNYAIILSGGIGSRMKTEGFPKQYIEVANKPILIYTLEVFENCSDVDKIVIVAADQWKEAIIHWLEEYRITKVVNIALPGSSRQESILSGLEACMCDSENDDYCVIIHDAVRPCVSEELIRNCLQACNEHEGCMPVIPVTDTVYQSMDGKSIFSLLDRSTFLQDKHLKRSGCVVTLKLTDRPQKKSWNKQKAQALSPMKTEWMFA